MSTELVRASTGNETTTSMSLSQAEKIAIHFQKSGYFADARDVSKAVTKILFGASLGLDPMASMSQIIIVQGKPSLSAHLMGRLLKASGKYRFTLDKLTNDECTITLYEKVETGPSAWEWFKHSPFTCLRDEFKHLHNSPTWKQYPKNLLYARTISNLTKMLCPEVLGGAVYLPDEIPGGCEVNPETLEPINVDTAIPENVIDAEIDIEPTNKQVKELRARVLSNNLDKRWVAKTLGTTPSFSWDALTNSQQIKLLMALDTYEELHPRDSNS